MIKKILNRIGIKDKLDLIIYIILFYPVLIFVAMFISAGIGKYVFNKVPPVEIFLVLFITYPPVMFILDKIIKGIKRNDWS